MGLKRVHILSTVCVLSVVMAARLFSFSLFQTLTHTLTHSLLSWLRCTSIPNCNPTVVHCRIDEHNIFSQWFIITKVLNRAIGMDWTCTEETKQGWSRVPHMTDRDKYTYRCVRTRSNSHFILDFHIKRTYSPIPKIMPNPIYSLDGVCVFRQMKKHSLSAQHAHTNIETPNKCIITDL